MTTAISPSVAPTDPAETAVMTVWPTIGATALGRGVGRLCGVKLGIGFFTLGKLLALATIPLSLTVFVWQLLPFVCRRYSLTDRRILVRLGYKAVEHRVIGLDEFDSIDVVILPGQDWLHAGELVFRRGAIEVFRLSGVSRPEVFRQVCRKAQTALLSFRGDGRAGVAGLPDPGRERRSTLGCLFAAGLGRLKKVGKFRVLGRRGGLAGLAHPGHVVGVDDEVCQHGGLGEFRLPMLVHRVQTIMDGEKIALLARGASGQVELEIALCGGRRTGEIGQPARSPALTRSRASAWKPHGFNRCTSVSITVQRLHDSQNGSEVIPR